MCGCRSVNERHISFDLSYDTAALSFWRALHFLLRSRFLEQHYTLSDGKHSNIAPIVLFSWALVPCDRKAHDEHPAPVMALTDD